MILRLRSYLFTSDSDNVNSDQSIMLIRIKALTILTPIKSILIKIMTILFDVTITKYGTERRRDRNVSKRKLAGGSIMTGCIWVIKFKAMSLIHTNGKRSRPNFKVGNVRIIAFCGTHKNCKPSAQNKNMTAKRSAEYTKGIPTRNLWALVTMMKDNNMILSSSQIRSQVRGCLPNTMNVSKQMVYQLRLKVRRLYKKFGEDQDLELFEQSLKNPDVVGSINDKAITDDETLIITKDVWISLMQENDFSADGSEVMTRFRNTCT